MAKHEFADSQTTIVCKCGDTFRHSVDYIAFDMLREHCAKAEEGEHEYEHSYTTVICRCYATFSAFPDYVAFNRFKEHVANANN